MLGKTEGKGEEGSWRWDGWIAITDTVDMNLGELREMEMVRERDVCLATEQQQ